jgi:hypothetical protein
MKLPSVQPFLLCLFFFTALGFTQDSVARDKGSSDGPAPAGLGLEVGQKAPAFSATDQFGREQSNETLKGSRGTVLLFFRSADW